MSDQGSLRSLAVLSDMESKMPSVRETVLAALHVRLQTLAGPVLRGDVLPERIPTTGLIILRDGKPGEPEVTLSPLTVQKLSEPS